MESSPLRRSNSTASVVGVKRPAPLLPAFEPLSSSPSLPRPQKRLARESHGLVSTYPTPVPTSSTHIMSSSPPPRMMPLPRPVSRRAIPAVSSERAPLSDVPTLVLREDGEPVLMGRSSASCQHQLSANRMISRVHVQATYKPAPNPFDRERVEILCMGWNGIKIHCQGKTYELAKGKTFTSDIKGADIMIDVHDARVLLQWPRTQPKEVAVPAVHVNSDQTWEEEEEEEEEDDDPTPTRNGRGHATTLSDSPLADRQQRLASPISPSPAVQSLIPPSSPLFTPTRARNSVVVYEDEPSPIRRSNTVDGSISKRAQHVLGDESSFDSSRSDDFSDHDEENDPIIHSFGPFGENLLPRMASFSAHDSPIRSVRPQQQPSKPMQSSPRRLSKAIASVTSVEDQNGGKASKISEEIERIQNHAVNQLAFSRLSSTPFSTLLNNLPPGLWRRDDRKPGLSTAEIRTVFESTKCIGKVAREGKDAAGKALEAEYYYVPDFDDDDMRREAVVHDLRKPGLRNCRKQHKQYFWRKPK
ncbi:hypothetical protein ASPZODRAFT_15710 [Penicilliopsis zonata CBS 506.65]|uniref:FHA domain-containing protein n=1 Tax=Penicilliopsis zonata CBS 506.65 TaxID=1073090 RepID=A0A1L9SJ14_9EURO|nr:hypothetical protein ASPZODRAFT_15710 [Penicilliopsis zonata CBS 506.65]OJJ47024.1 hypothetical protein ASPZODRAFT_15710 [Penicilliopsis zonata CBS 506.65]